jgi:hypothetical protein
VSLVTHSTKRNRVYDRAFDHDEARELRKQGWSYGRLAEHFGVSPAAVMRVLDPATQKRMDEHTRKYAREHLREPCRGGCGRLVWVTDPDRSGYCVSCWRAGESAPNERDNELRCLKCGEWKPDSEFRLSRGRKIRRGRFSWCRPCESRARDEHRKKNRARALQYDREYKARKEGRMSKFVVLKQDGEKRWVEEARGVEAGSRKTAIERVADSEGVYAAMTEGQITGFPVKPVQRFGIVDNGAGPE